MAKHTPGPWHRNIRANGRYPVVFAGRNTHVCMASQQADPAETEANIDLLSAAPELLAALKAALDWVPAHLHSRHLAESAIAKAEGLK